jgi:divalent metal cation (Fe/Co/Zn/Cd) transporter
MMEGMEPTPPNRAAPSTASHDLAHAIRLEALTLAWMVAEATLALWAGIAAGSVLLVAFGADSIIELASAVVLMARLLGQWRGRLDEAGIERAEARAGRIAGALLYLLAAYVVIESGLALWQREAAGESWLGMAVTGAAALGMPVLARAKLRVAARIGSGALRADAMETLTCGYLSWAVLAGLAANRLLGWWWLDAAAALAIVPILVKEGREALSGGCSCCHGEEA